MIFHSALVRELRATSGVVFAALSLIVVSTKLVRYLDRASLGKIDQSLALPLIGLSSAGSIALVVSLTAFMTVLLVLGRWWKDSEMAVWLASGTSLWALWRPVTTFLIPLAIVSAFCSLVLTPWARAQMEQLTDRQQASSDLGRLSPGQFREVGNGRQILFVELPDESSGRLGKVFSVTNSNAQGLVVLMGRAGEVYTDQDGHSWVRVSDGTRTDFGLQPGHFHENLETLRFRAYELRTDIQGGFGARGDVGLRGQTSLSLLNSSSPAHLGELAFRIGAPLLTVALSLLAIPLSFVGQRMNRWYSLVLALLLVILSNNLLAVIQAWVAKGNLLFVWSWWPLPLGLLLLAAGLTWFRAAARRSGVEVIRQRWRDWGSRGSVSP